MTDPETTQQSSARETENIPPRMVSELVAISELVKESERGDIHPRDLYAAVDRLESGWCFCAHPDQQCPLHEMEYARG
jgi:hypothetical protein